MTYKKDMYFKVFVSIRFATMEIYSGQAFLFLRSRHFLIKRFLVRGYIVLFLVSWLTMKAVIKAFCLSPMLRQRNAFPTHVRTETIINS